MNDTQEPTKICTKCPENGPQPLTNFVRASRLKSGYSTECKACHNQRYWANREHHLAVMAAHKAAFPEKKKASDAAWRAKNLAKKQAMDRAYHHANRAAILIQQAARRERNREATRAADRAKYAANPAAHRARFLKAHLAHPEKKKARDARYHQAHLEEAKAAQARRRACQKQARKTERVYRKAVYTRDKGVCQICFKRVNPALTHPDPGWATLDHVIPLAEGGDHTMQNIVLAHFSCNASKGQRHTMPQQQLLFG
jgi:5-methylcytosine-specific restriction endonuclease McrA